MIVPKKKSKDLAKIICQKCLEIGSHYTYECKNKRKILLRDSRTKILNKNLSKPLISVVQEPPKKKMKNKKSSEKSSSSTSSSSSSSSSSDSESSSSSSSSSSDSSSSSSDSN